MKNPIIEYTNYIHYYIVIMTTVTVKPNAEVTVPLKKVTFAGNVSDKERERFEKCLPDGCEPYYRWEISKDTGDTVFIIFDKLKVDLVKVIEDWKNNTSPIE